MALPSAPPPFSRARATPTSMRSTAALRPGPRPGSNCSPASTSRARWDPSSGGNGPRTAFAEFAGPAGATPSIDAAELARLMRERSDIVVLDSRPFDEYQRVSIPTAVNVPGAELVLRVRDLAPSP